MILAETVSPLSVLDKVSETQQTATTSIRDAATAKKKHEQNTVELVFVCVHTKYLADARTFTPTIRASSFHANVCFCRPFSLSTVLTLPTKYESMSSRLERDWTKPSAWDLNVRSPKCYHCSCNTIFHFLYSCGHCENRLAICRSLFLR